MRSFVGLAVPGITIASVLGVACAGEPSPPAAEPTSPPTPSDEPLPAGPAEESDAELARRPPAMTARVDGQDAAPALGWFRWPQGEQRTIGGDIKGVTTDTQPLQARRGATVLLQGYPVGDPPIAELDFRVHPRPPQPAWRTDDGGLFWIPEGDPDFEPGEILPDGGRFTLDVEPGLYLLEFRLSIERGRARYGLVVDVVAADAPSLATLPLIPSPPPARDANRPGSDTPTPAPPPELFAEVGGVAAPFGLGTYCWTVAQTGEFTQSVCADSQFGVTGSAALVIPSSALVQIAYPRTAPLIYSAGVGTDRVTGPAAFIDADSAIGWPTCNRRRQQEVELHADGLTVPLDLPTGRYLLSLSLFVQGGDAFYALIVDVRAPGEGETPAVVGLAELPPLPDSEQGPAVCASLSDPRTGLPRSLGPAIVAIIEAIERHDSEAVLEALRTRNEPCAQAEGLGGPPKCVDDDPEGAEYEVFRHIACEGGWVPVEDLAESTRALLDATGPLVGAGKIDPDEAQDLYREGDTLLVFAPEEGLPAIAAVAFLLAGDQILLTRTCATLEDLLADKDGRPP